MIEKITRAYVGKLVEHGVISNNDAVPNTQIGYAQALYYSDRSSYSTIIGEAYAASDR